MSIRALVVDPVAPAGVRMADVPEPAAGPGVVVVDVRHASLNHGDLNDAKSGRVPPGAVLGSDVAGIVAQAAETGPPVGTRVVGLARGAFAEQVAVDLSAIAEVPHTIDLAEAAAIPVAGLAALQALRASGPALGRRVLITGAAGGVGRFAVQLAAHAGAYVLASIGSEARGAGLRELGADEIVIGVDGIASPVDVVIDNVGGQQLVKAWELLAPGGSIQCIGWTSTEPAIFPPYSTIGPPKSLTSFLIGGTLGPDLATLIGLVAAKHLTVNIGWRGGWDQYAEATEALTARRVAGKAVLDVS